MSIKTDTIKSSRNPTRKGILVNIYNIYDSNVKSSRYPPRKSILVNIQISTMLAYSAKKKKTNITAACSVINPLTNSDSKENERIKCINSYN